MSRGRKEPDLTAALIDTHMHGRAGITAAFVVQGERTALIETGPATSLEVTCAGLAGLGIERLDWIVVTHIHLDHSGAAGALAERFPEATVAVHEVGAPHLVDPSKLLASAGRIYGDKMDELWGTPVPVPGDRIRALGDGDEIDLGGRVLRAVDTPGHARHHHAFFDEATGDLFTGDALGIRLPGTSMVRPATPPPEFDLEQAVASIEKLRGLGASALYLTHFGHCDGSDGLAVDDACERAVDALHRWNELILVARRDGADVDEAAEKVRAAVEGSVEGDDLQASERMEQATSYRMNTQGYFRYQDRLARAQGS